MRTRVFALLAIDKGRGGSYTDEEFLEITNGIFSTFDSVVENGKNIFKINEQRFVESNAKIEVEKIIAGVVKAEDEYREEMNRWEMEQRFGHQAHKEDGEHAESGEDAQSEIDRLIRQSAERESERDESQLTKRELQELIDTALDDGDYKEVERLSKFMKEGAEIYLREIERINEIKKTSTNL
jgi:ribosomal protein S18